MADVCKGHHEHSLCEQTVAASQGTLDMGCQRRRRREHDGEVFVRGKNWNHLASQRDAATWNVPPRAKYHEAPRRNSVKSRLQDRLAVGGEKVVVGMTGQRRGQTPSWQNSEATRQRRGRSVSRLDIVVAGHRRHQTKSWQHSVATRQRGGRTASRKNVVVAGERRDMRTWWQNKVPTRQRRGRTALRQDRVAVGRKCTDLIVLRRKFGGVVKSFGSVLSHCGPCAVRAASGEVLFRLIRCVQFCCRARPKSGGDRCHDVAAYLGTKLPRGVWTLIALKCGEETPRDTKAIASLDAAVLGST